MPKKPMPWRDLRHRGVMRDPVRRQLEADIERAKEEERKNLRNKSDRTSDKIDRLLTDRPKPWQTPTELWIGRTDIARRANEAVKNDARPGANNRRERKVPRLDAGSPLQHLLYWLEWYDPIYAREIELGIMLDGDDVETRNAAWESISSILTSGSLWGE